MKLLASIKKEWLLLIRDKGGLGILFLMPMVLVVVMAVVQDAPFRDYQEQQIPVLFVNEDSGEISQQIMKAIEGGSANLDFNITSNKESAYKSIGKSGVIALGLFKVRWLFGGPKVLRDTEDKLEMVYDFGANPADDTEE